MSVHDDEMMLPDDESGSDALVPVWTTDGHLDEGTIHTWLDGAFDDASASAVALHVASCTHCQAEVAEARGFIAGASRMVRGLDAVPAGVVSQEDAARTASRIVAAAGWQNENETLTTTPVIALAPRTRVRRWRGPVFAVGAAAALVFLMIPRGDDVTVSPIASRAASESASESALESAHDSTASASVAATSAPTSAPTSPPRLVSQAPRSSAKANSAVVVAQTAPRVENAASDVTSAVDTRASRQASEASSLTGRAAGAAIRRVDSTVMTQLAERAASVTATPPAAASPPPRASSSPAGPPVAPPVTMAAAPPPDRSAMFSAKVAGGVAGNAAGNVAGNVASNVPSKDALRDASSRAFADSGRAISGQLRATDGAPIVGATVLARGKNEVVATTDKNGRFTMQVREDSVVLSARRLGFVGSSQSLKLTPADSTRVDMTLKPTSNALSAAIVSAPRANDEAIPSHCWTLRGEAAYAALRLPNELQLPDIDGAKTYRVRWIGWPETNTALMVRMRVDNDGRLLGESISDEQHVRLTLQRVVGGWTGTATHTVDGKRTIQKVQMKSVADMMCNP